MTEEQEIAWLRRKVESLQTELRELRELLARRSPTPPPFSEDKLLKEGVA